MRVAIPIFGQRVAPVFDWCRRIAVVDTDAVEQAERREADLAGVMPFHRPDRLADLGVEVLLCGGISPSVAQLVEAHGIRVVPWVAGDVDAVLAEFLAGRLPSERFMMPGCPGGGGGRRRRRGRRWEAGGRDAR
jgi:predicted Fe-Mo cluster-binding NifX family protein